MENYLNKLEIVNGENRTAKILAVLKEYNDALGVQYRSLMAGVEELGFENYGIIVAESNKHRYEMLVSCCCALDKLSHVVEHWESAQREDEYKELRIWNLMTCIAHAWDIATNYASDEASKVRHAIKKIIKVYNLPFNVDKDVNKYIARV